MDNRTDAELVALYAAGGAGGEPAFAEIVRRHGALVYAACRRQLGDAAADDAVQAVFMLLARKARTLSRKEALAGWLHGAARLVARGHLRAERRRKLAEKGAAEMREAERRGAAVDWESVRPELDAALAALPKAYRDAVILACLEGRSEAEAARELGVPAGTVKSRLARGLERLRGRLGQRGAVLSVAGLGAALSAHGVEALPAALAARLPALGAAGAVGLPVAASASMVMMKGAMKAMFWMKVKVAVTAVAAAMAVSTAVPLTMAAVRGAEPAVPKAEAGKVAWGEAVGGLQAGLVPLGGDVAKDWPSPFLCLKCRELNRMLVVSKCEDCGSECRSNRKLKLCDSCAAKERVCQGCGAAKPAGATFTEGEPLIFEVHLLNVGDAPKDVTGAGRVFQQDLVFTPVDGSPPRRARFVGARPMGGGGMVPQQLEKGRQAVWTVSVGGQDWQFEDARTERDKSYPPIESLPAGKYAVKVSHSGAKLTAGPAEIEIKGAAADTVPASGAEPRDPGSRPDRSTPGDWQKLFADEDWYKGKAGEEQVISGTLEGIPVAEGMATTLQRDSYYKIGGHTIYTGANRVPALDQLVGRKVEIRGKVVDMELEGREISEIWPASVRATEGGAPDVRRGVKMKVPPELMPDNEPRPYLPQPETR